ncbi:MAG: helix-turn-helix transcriptional regulator [Vicinamibacterales bacterium]|jgi:transcriptional regulator with XRE-family HTH domain|nr:helix-turn-helix transcriptional regulator [Vicinamibacterales bacterium]
MSEVKARRKEAKLTQAALAKKIRVQQSEISRIERGWIPPVKLRQRLSKALGVPEVELFGAEVERAAVGL